jgi:hypothetical protein
MLPGYGTSSIGSDAMDFFHAIPLHLDLSLQELAGSSAAWTATLLPWLIGLPCSCGSCRLFPILLFIAFLLPHAF